jgi:hypothetical protein
MTKTHTVSFRLDAATWRKLNLLRLSRHCSRGQILREATDLYFRAHMPVVKEPPEVSADS